MPQATEQEKVVHLVGTKDNPAREPSKRPSVGKGSIGDTAFMDAVILVVIAWVIVLFLSYSLRSHNV
jgi:hypothetical protein